ncbi:MAG: c-type cytochrome [Caulobacterales bacterium]
MSDLTFNKIAGAALATGLAIIGLQQVSLILFQKSPPAKAGDAITIAAEAGGGGAEAPDVPPDWGTVLPKADIAQGEATTAKCASCHKFDAAGTNSTGPGLYGVVGRPPGSHPGFVYSSPMMDFAKKTPVWTYDQLYGFLKGPGNYISGTKMTFVGLKAPQDRINLIAYLHSLGSSLPIPAPAPAAAAAAPDKGATPAAGAATPAKAAAGDAKAASAGKASTAPAKAG